jgi:hypothetical protein
MIKKSLTVLALGALVAVGACKKADNTENVGVDTTAAPAAVPPVVSDTGMAPMTPDTGAAVDTTAVDTTAADTAAH